MSLMLATRSSSQCSTPSTAPPVSFTPVFRYDAGMARLSSRCPGWFDGRWVAQVASKSVGITDALQTAANGTHTFHAVDILADSPAAVSSVSSVLVLCLTDFGNRSFAADGQAYWITVVDVGFTSSDQVKAWCAGTYPTLTAEELANACAARTLTPPRD